VIITVHTESLCKSGRECSFPCTHFANQHNEIARSNKTSYRTGNGMGITKI
jgi:hypothetical protein